jgi:hypothetical protein
MHPLVQIVNETLYIVNSIRLGFLLLERLLDLFPTTYEKRRMMDEVKNLDNEIKKLENNPSLQSLYLSLNPIGAAQAFASALEHNNSLQSLYLAYNQIGDAEVQALASALEHNTSLQNLDLDSNEIGDAGMQALSTAIQTNLSLETMKTHPALEINPDQARQKLLRAWLRFCALGLMTENKLNKANSKELLVAELPSPKERAEMKKVPGNSWRAPMLTFKFKSKKGKSTAVTLAPELSHAVADMLGVPLVRRFRQT